ncbi:MAG: SurA N-terminal domain-containing protein [Clostridia bacterium]|nr:SurA N-terminal domain-containing protein [Clostridia bacterium]
MKKTSRFISVCLLLVLSLSLLAGCNKKEEQAYAIKVGDRIISELEYSRTAAILRENYLATLDTEDTLELWETEVEDGVTLSDMVVEAVCNQLIVNKLYEIQFDALGLTLSDDEIAAINKDLSEMVEAAGGMTAFHEVLAEKNYTYEEYEAELHAYAKKEKVLDYYFGENGVKPTSDQDIKDWYNLHNARIKTVSILKVNASTWDPLSEADLENAKKKSEDAYAAALRKSDVDLFDDVISIFSDSDDNESFVVNEDNGYDEALTKAALDMEVGEVRWVETEYAYGVVKRYDGTADDVFTEEIRQVTLETIRSDEIDAYLEQWEENQTVTVNQKAISQYRPEKFVAE